MNYGGILNSKWQTNVRKTTANLCGHVTRMATIEAANRLRFAPK